MGRVGGADAADRIAAQSDDVANAGVPVGAHDVVDLVARGATQVRCAAGFSVVSLTMRATVAWVRSRVEPPAP